MFSTMADIKSAYVYIIYEVGASLVAQKAKNLPAIAGDQDSIPGLGRFPWRREWQPTLVFLPG